MAGAGWSRAPRASGKPVVAGHRSPAAGNASARPAAPATTTRQAARPAASARQPPFAPTAKPPTAAAKSAAVVPKPPLDKPAATASPKLIARKAAAVPRPAAPTRPSSSSCGSASLNSSISSTSAATSILAPTSSTSSASSFLSTSHRAASGIVVPILDLNRPQTNVTPLKRAESAWDSGVWGLQRGSDRFVVKSSPYYSPKHAARVQALSRGRSRAPVLVTEQQAMHEVNMAREMAAAAAQHEESCSSSIVGDIYVQPLLVATRACTRTFVGPKGNKSGCPAALAPDREVVTVYPHHPCGDAVHHVFCVSRRLVSGLTSGSLSLVEVVECAVELLTGLTRDMLSLVGAAHQLGYVLCDHKLENMVYDNVKARWQLIDAAEVQRCRLGETYTGPCRRTPFYEAPEQAAGLGSDSRSDVFACGRAVQMAVSDCLDRFSEALGGQHTQAFVEAHDALTAALEPLAAVAVPCADPERPEQRPTAGEALGILMRGGQGRGEPGSSCLGCA